MADAPLDRTELARRFAEECDAIASRGAAPDCAEQMAAINAAFDAEYARRRADEAKPAVVKRRLAKP